MVRLVRVAGHAVGKKSVPRTDKRNWVCLSDVYEAIFTHYRSRNFRPIKIKTVYNIEDKQNFSEYKHEDCIFLMRYDNHAFVGLYLTKTKSIYIADGTNKYLDVEKKQLFIEKTLRENLGIVKFVGLRFDEQTRFDESGSSAVVIAGEFWRCYESNLVLPHFLTVEKSIYTQVKKKFHKFESAPIGVGKKLIHQFPKFECQACSKKYTKNKKKAFLLHFKQCRITANHM